VVAQAIRHIPQSVKIWSKAVELESETAAKRKVLRKGGSVASSLVILRVNYLPLPSLSLSIHSFLPPSLPPSLHLSLSPSLPLSLPLSSGADTYISKTLEVGSGDGRS